MKRNGLFAKWAAVVISVILLCLSLCACTDEKEAADETASSDTTAAASDTTDAASDTTVSAEEAPKHISKVLFPDSYEYEYDDSGRIIKGTDETGDVREYEYDDDGNVIKVLYYSDGLLVSYCVPLLDDNGMIVERSFYGPNDELRGFEKYNENELVIEEHNYLSGVNTVTKNEYDDKNNMIKSELYDENGIILEWTVYEYSEDGVLLKDLKYNENGIAAAGEYRDNGIIKKGIIYDEYGNVYMEYDFDDDGIPTKRITYYRDEMGTVTGRSEDTFDSEGEFLKTITYDADGEIVNVIEYEQG